MRVFDMPRDRAKSGRPWRIAVTGSRRIYDAFEALVVSGKLVKVWADYASVPRTLGEVHQLLQYNLQLRDIPDRLVPFVFDHPEFLESRSPVRRRLMEGADAFVIEVSDLQQIRCGDYYFQRNAFLRRFVSPLAAAVMPWYRALSVGAPISQDMIETALANLEHGSPVERDLVAQILRDIHLETVEAHHAAIMIERLKFKPSAKWVFVSPFVTPSLDGSLIEDRRRLVDTLGKAAEASGTMMFNPTDLVSWHGGIMTPTVGCPDLHYYAPELQAAVGEAILSSIESSAVGPGRARPANIGVVPEQVADRINALLIELHGGRLAELGEDGSGLHAHYRRLLELGQLVRPRAAQIGNIVSQHLPDFDRCDVLASGLGEIPFVLAALGQDTVAFEDKPTRLAAIVAGAAYLVERGVVPQSRLQCVEGRLPAYDDSPGAYCRTLGVLTEFSLDASRANQDVALARFSRYDAVLVDPVTLVRSARNSTEGEEILERFRDLGFSIFRDFPAAQLVYCAKDPALEAASASSGVTVQPGATGSLETSPQRLNTMLVALHRERLARLGPIESGLYTHYESLLGHGEIVRKIDAEIAELVQRSLPRFKRCHVLRAGLGELAFLLAGLSQPTVAFESNGNRMAAIGAGVLHLADNDFLVATDLETALGLVPESGGTSDTLAIATNLVFTLSADEEQEVLSRLSGYGAILINPAVFLRVRDTEADQTAAIEQLGALGFSLVRRFPDLRLAYCAKPAGQLHRPDSRIALSGRDEQTEWEEARPLVFDRLVVRWEDLKFGQPFSFRFPPLGEWSLRSFPLPGCPIPQDLSAVQIGSDGLSFPSYGAYNVVGPFGAVKILLIDPADDDDARILALSRFVAEATYHSGADTHLSYERTERYPTLPCTLMRKLFYSDQPLALWCAHIADVLAYLLHLLGYSCRKLSLKNTTGIGHIFLEVYFPTTRRWLMVDPDFGVMLKHGGEFLSADDVVRLRASGRTLEIELVELADKCFSSHDVNFPVSFTGQFTWTPEYLVEKRIKNLSYYHEVVIDGGFMGVDYCTYRFGHIVTARIRPTIEDGRPVTLAEVEAQVPMPQ